MMSNFAVGVINSVENKDGKSGTFQVIMFQADGQERAMNMAEFNSTESHNIWSAMNKRVEIEYEEKPNGKYTNRSVKSWKLLEESLQNSPAPSSPSTTPTSYVGTVVASVDPRQENINRQSAWKEAVRLVTMALEQGHSIVGGGEKGKKAQKDPEVLFEYTKLMARRIKDDVQNGDWSNPMAVLEQDVATTPDGEGLFDG